MNKRKHYNFIDGFCSFGGAVILLITMVLAILVQYLLSAENISQLLCFIIGGSISLVFYLVAMFSYIHAVNKRIDKEGDN